MKKNKLKRFLIVLGSVVSLLFLVLVVHIYLVTRDKNDDKRIRQLARIDFKQEVDSMLAMTIKNKVLSISGVDAGYFNINDKTFIYSFNPKIQNADRIFIDLISSGNYKAVRYRTNETLVANGCPVIDKSSISYKIASLFKN